MTYRTGYSDAFRSQWEDEQKEREREAAERKQENADLRAARLKGLADERAAKQREHDARKDAELEPAKVSAKRQWLYDHPGMTEVDFERHAWPLLRATLIEEEQIEQAAVHFRQAGYSEERAVAAGREIVAKRASGQR